MHGGRNVQRTAMATRKKVALLPGPWVGEIAAVLAARKDLSLEMVDSFSPGQARGYDVVILGMGKGGEEPASLLVQYVYAGGRALLMYLPDCPAEGRWLPFPTLVRGIEPLADRIVKPIVEYELAAGIEPFELPCSQLSLLRGNEGVVFLRNVKHRNVGILGAYGQGKVLALGFPLGLDDSGMGRPLGTPESDLLRNGMQWLAGDKQFEIPVVFMESRRLPPLPKRPGRIINAAAPKGRRFLAGASRIDVTPSGPVEITGFQPRTSTGVHDRLHVRALVLDNGEERLAVVSCDALHFYELPMGFQEMERWRGEIEKRTGIPSSNILLTASHTHSSCRLPFEEASVEAVVRAWEARRDARIGAGSKMIYGIGANRRLLDGTGLWGANQPNPDGVMDNECGIIRVEDLQRNIIAVAVNYSSHPTVLEGDNTLLSGDYAGIGMTEIEKRLGGHAVSLFLQGCSGDTGTQAFREGRTIAEAEKLGVKLADEATRILAHIDVVSWLPLKMKIKQISLPQWEPKEPQEGVTMPAFSGEWIPDVIQAFALGDCLLLSTGSMEPYVDIGLDVKEASKFRHTFLVTNSNGPWLGYLPSRWGFSVNDPDARSTRFSPEAPDALVKACLRLHDQVRD